MHEIGRLLKYLLDLWATKLGCGGADARATDRDGHVPER